MKTGMLLGIIALFIGSFSSAIAAAAEQAKTATVPLEFLTPEQRAQILQVKTEAELKAKIETYGKWVGLGKEVGEAVNGSLGALTQNADTFAKTGVGQFTMAIVAYKVLGRELIGVLIAIPLQVVVFALFVWSYRRSCIGYRTISKKTAEGKVYEQVAPLYDGDELAPAQIVHVVALLFMSIIIWCSLVQ